MNITLLPKNILAALTLICVLLGPLLQISNAAMNRGIYFDDEIIVDGQTLNLHGIGLLKWKYIVNVYLVALYKPKAVPIKDILKNVPKRLEYYFFVDMEASDFQSTGFQLMTRNIGKENTQRLTEKLEALNELYQDVKEGQRYTLTFLPGKGLEMALDNKSLGLVEGDEFGSAYLSIWLGPDPVSTSLQKGMFAPETKK
jgi:hypothetical protein